MQRRSVLAGGAAWLTGCAAVDEPARAMVDIVHYDARIEPDLAARSLRGCVTLTPAHRNGGALWLDGGALEIDAVRVSSGALPYTRQAARLRVELPAGIERVSIDYHGNPRDGMFFAPDGSQVHTAFNTRQWLPCQDAPERRATLDLRVVLPSRLKVAANGALLSEQTWPDGRFESAWRLARPMPSCLFGFAAGPFREVDDLRPNPSDGPRLRVLATPSFSDAELRRIFRDTAPMLAFCERAAGVRYAGASYTQVLLAGRASQELADISLLGERYGRGVLQDETAASALWPGAHELTHQWWGNGVTNVDWRHFWLNEGIATFMTAACLGERFGAAAYDEAINGSRGKYEALRAAGKDRALVFDDWSAPSADDRSIVYDKGAWVMHLLRERLGPARFDAALRGYTQQHWGGSVSTPDLQRAMEQAGGTELRGFFDEWVYRV